MKKIVFLLTQMVCVSAFAQNNTCFVMDSKDTLWATGGAALVSCDITSIQNQITQQYGTVRIWKFKNDSQIQRDSIVSKAMQSKGFLRNETNLSSYVRTGKRITENVEGCEMTNEIVEESPDSISLTTIGASGTCGQARLSVVEQQKKRPPIKYLKING